jgi:hypothetical protein
MGSKAILTPHMHFISDAPYKQCFNKQWRHCEHELSARGQVSQRSAPLAMVGVHLVQDRAAPLRPPLTEPQHRRGRGL